MGLAREMKRKAMKSARIGEKKGLQDYARAKKAVRHVTTREIVVRESIRMEAITNIMVTMDVTTHRVFGWGSKNILRLRKKVHSEMECIHRKYVTVEDLEKIIQDELKIYFDLEKESKGSEKWSLQKRVEYEVIRETSAAFLLALRDEFGMGTQRAMRAYNTLRAIWDDIHGGRLTIADMRAERDRIGKRRATAKTMKKTA